MAAESKAGSPSGMVGWADCALDDETTICDGLCMFLPLVTEASLDWLPLATWPARHDDGGKETASVPSWAP